MKIWSENWLQISTVWLLKITMWIEKLADIKNVTITIYSAKLFLRNWLSHSICQGTSCLSQRPKVHLPETPNALYPGWDESNSHSHTLTSPRPNLTFRVTCTKSQLRIWHRRYKSWRKWHKQFWNLDRDLPCKPRQFFSATVQLNGNPQNKDTPPKTSYPTAYLNPFLQTNMHNNSSFPKLRSQESQTNYLSRNKDIHCLYSEYVTCWLTRIRAKQTAQQDHGLATFRIDFSCC
jgi:hypothetical protein